MTATRTVFERRAPSRSRQASQATLCANKGPVSLASEAGPSNRLGQLFGECEGRQQPRIQKFGRNESAEWI